MSQKTQSGHRGPTERSTFFRPHFAVTLTSTRTCFGVQIALASHAQNSIYMLSSFFARRTSIESVIGSLVFKERTSSLPVKRTPSSCASLSCCVSFQSLQVCEVEINAPIGGFVVGGLANSIPNTGYEPNAINIGHTLMTRCSLKIIKFQVKFYHRCLV